MTNYADELDVKADLFTIGTKTQGLTSDIVKFQPKDFQARFIIEQFLLAHRWKNYIPDKNIGKQVFNKMIAEIEALSIVNRNKPENHLANTILKEIQRVKEEDEEKPTKTLERDKPNE